MPGPTQPDSTSPFAALPDYHNNACINNYRQFEDLARDYEESADTLVRCAMEDSKTLDAHVYAICFLYRHAFELLLKGLSWKSGYARHGDKASAVTDALGRSHNLSGLWGDVERRTRELLGTQFPLAPNETTLVKGLFAAFETHDSKSDAFRYPMDKQKRRTLTNLTHVNVRALKDRVHEVSELLDRLVYCVDYYYAERSNYS